MSESPPKYLYRFRSIDALLGEREELQKQEIFFASPQKLNDAVEGFRDLFWKGDEVVWRNLFAHYLLCLDNTAVLLMLSGEDSPIPRPLSVFITA